MQIAALAEQFAKFSFVEWQDLGRSRGRRYVTDDFEPSAVEPDTRDPGDETLSTRGEYLSRFHAAS